MNALAAPALRSCGEPAARTLRRLAWPGRLTLEHFEGRRRRYLQPLWLFLAASFVFFLVAKVLPAQPRYEYTATATLGNTTLVYTCKSDLAFCDWFNAYARERFGDMPRERVLRHVRERFVAWTPYAMFFLLPAFALITRIAYWGRERTYGEHLVFAFHVHSFVFLLAAVLVPLGLFAAAGLAAAIYLGLALDRVFGGRAVATVLRFTLISSLHAALLAGAVFAAILAAVVL